MRPPALLAVLVLVHAAPLATAGVFRPALPDGGTPLADAALEQYPRGSRKLSLLQFVNKSDVYATPYPHIAKKGALDPVLYKALEEAYPPLNKAFKRGYPKNNIRIDLPAFKTLKNYGDGKADKSQAYVHPLWQRFVDYHISDSFYKELSDLAGDYIARSFGRAVVHGDARYKGVGTRTLKRNAKSSVDMDCQISYNTPVLTKNSVRGPHIDDGAKIFGGLFYMRNPEDKASGGDFLVYDCKGACKPLPRDKIKSSAGHNVHTQFGSSTVKVAKKVSYAANSLVIFINSKRAVHGVTPRSPSRYPRTFVNLIGNKR